MLLLMPYSIYITSGATSRMKTIKVSSPRSTQSLFAICNDVAKTRSRQREMEGGIDLTLLHASRTTHTFGCCFLVSCYNIAMVSAVFWLIDRAMVLKNQRDIELLSQEDAGS